MRLTGTCECGVQITFETDKKSEAGKTYKCFKCKSDVVLKDMYSNDIAKEEVNE